MPPYWYNKALPNPTRYFIFNFLIISFIFIENEMPFRCDMRFEKGEIKLGGLEPRVDRVKKHVSYHLRDWNWCENERLF